MLAILVRRYLTACAVEGFDPDTPLFVASGIFTAMDEAAEANLAAVRRDLASHVFHKNQACPVTCPLPTSSRP